MNNTELESLIRTILTEQLTPSAAETPACTGASVALFDDVDSAICAAHAAFLRYQEAPLKTRSAIIAAIRAEIAPCIHRKSVSF